MDNALLHSQQHLTAGVHHGATDSYDHEFTEQIDKEFSKRWLLHLQWICIDDNPDHALPRGCLWRSRRSRRACNNLTIFTIDVGHGELVESLALGVILDVLEPFRAGASDFT